MSRSPNLWLAASILGVLFDMGYHPSVHALASSVAMKPILRCARRWTSQNCDPPPFTSLPMAPKVSHLGTLSSSGAKICPHAWFWINSGGSFPCIFLGTFRMHHWSSHHSPELEIEQFSTITFVLNQTIFNPKSGHLFSVTGSILDIDPNVKALMCVHTRSLPKPIHWYNRYLLYSICLIMKIWYCTRDTCKSWISGAPASGICEKVSIQYSIWVINMVSMETFNWR